MGQNTMLLLQSLSDGPFELYETRKLNPWMSIWESIVGGWMPLIFIYLSCNLEIYNQII